MVGLTLVIISLSTASSLVSNNISKINRFSDSLLEGLFNEITNEVQIMPDDSAYFSYSVFSSDVLLMWGVRIINYPPGDKLSINISNIFDDDYGNFIQNDPIHFEVLEIHQSDTVNLEIKNIGTRNVNVIAMFSEDPDSFESSIKSLNHDAVFVFTISGFFLVLGIIILIIGIIVILIDLKNNQNNKRSY